MQDGWKAVWSIPYVSVTFFPSLKQNFIAYCSSKVSDCIFEIHQLWQSGFSRVYSNCCCSYSFELEIIKIGESSHKMYSNNIVNFQESTTILNAHTKKVWKVIICTSYIHIYIYKFSLVCMCVCVCVCVCIYIYIYIYMFVCVCVCIYIYIYIYIYIRNFNLIRYFIFKVRWANLQEFLHVRLRNWNFIYIYIYIYIMNERIDTNVKIF